MSHQSSDLQLDFLLINGFHTVMASNGINYYSSKVLIQIYLDNLLIHVRRKDLAFVAAISMYKAQAVRFRNATLKVLLYTTLRLRFCYISFS